MIITDKETIINFLRGETEDYKGRTYKDILECSDQIMEQCHDQVQWMFPLHEESNFASTYPILTKEVIDEILDLSNSEIKTAIIFNFLLAKERMEKFYGFGDYEDIDKQRKWCKPNSHNLLRITRIIRCLRIFGLEKTSHDFYNNAIKAAERFLMDDDITFKYWKKALKEDVWESLR